MSSGYKNVTVKFLSMVVNSLDEFISPSLRHHYGLYIIRKLLLQNITAILPNFKGTLIDVGCGRMPYRAYIMERAGVKKYIGVDWPGSPYHIATPPDVYWDGKELPFEENFADTCIATEVFEHLPNATEVAREINRILKPGGILFITVPFFWPFHEVPFDEYRYTPFSLKRILQEAGFSKDKIFVGATGGWLATLAQVITQVVSIEVRSPRTKKYLKLLSKPLIRWLLKNDQPPSEFTNHTMALSLYVIAYK